MRRRVYLTGNSMGGYGSWAWGGHSPKRLAAIAPVVGGIGPGGPKDVTPNLKNWAKNLAKVPVYAFAGGKDRVVPAERSERMVAEIRKAEGSRQKLKYFQRPDTMPGSWFMIAKNFTIGCLHSPKNDQSSFTCLVHFRLGCPGVRTGDFLS